MSDEVPTYKSAIFSFLAASTFWLFQKMLRNNYQKIQKELTKIERKSVIQASKLENILQSQQQIQLNQDEYFLVEGIAQMNSSSEILESEDKLRKIIYAQRRKYDMVVSISSNGDSSMQQKLQKEKLKAAEKFQLQDRLIGNRDGQSKIFVEDFKKTYIFPNLYNYKCQKEQIDQQLINKNINGGLEGERNDEQRANQELKKESVSITPTVFTVGFKIEENSILVGSPLLVYARALYDETNRTIILIAPEYFASDKNQIIRYFQNQINFKKFIEFLLIAGILSFSIYGIKKLKDILQSKKQPKAHL